MENVVLTVHLILALLLIGIVLLQRSEGGGLGMGSGGGGGGVMTGRQAANALTKLTWILAAAFLVTSLTLTIIAARNASGSSVLDQLNINAPGGEGGSSAPDLPAYTPPPGVGQPVTPPAPDTGAAADSATAGPSDQPAADAATGGEPTTDVPVTPLAAN
ncbi:MAG: preprotein translocase subunit SecG [Paracoccus sp. (in: a-proteobacteria)]